MSVKTKIKFSSENVQRACFRKFGFCVVAYEPALSVPGIYRKGKPVTEIWGRNAGPNRVSLGPAKRSDWVDFIALIDKKWPGVMPADYASRNPPATARFFKAAGSPSRREKGKRCQR